MNCPVCNRNLAPTLSICPSCGAMMNDSVREELKDKISIAPAKPVKLEAKSHPPVEAKINPPLLRRASSPLAPKPQTAPPIQKPTPPVVAPPPKPHTMEIAAKPTSPTLVEFQNKNAALPDWRLQLQNAVRKRVEKGTANAPIEAAASAPRVHLPTNGANALKAEVIEQPAPVANNNPRLENALRRIEASRRQFLSEPNAESPLKTQTAAAAAPAKNFPFYIATKNAEVLPKPPQVEPPVNLAPKPKIEDLPIIEKTGLDTNKLKPLPNASVISASLEKKSEAATEIEEIEDAPPVKISSIRAELDEEEILDPDEISETEEEIEDIAPFAMRFNAGLFDLIIGSFTAALLLSPLMLAGGNWFSPAGLLAFLVTVSIVMFIYLTTSIGFFGKTLGMKLFSLETIDIEENDYPTLHQAAVSSSVYLISLALGGVGFLPAFFNSEKRAAHDLLSGTIIVKDY